MLFFYEVSTICLNMQFFFLRQHSNIWFQYKLKSMHEYYCIKKAWINGLFFFKLTFTKAKLIIFFNLTTILMNSNKFNPEDYTVKQGCGTLLFNSSYFLSNWQFRLCIHILWNENQFPAYKQNFKENVIRWHIIHVAPIFSDH